MTTENPYKPVPKRYILSGSPESPVVKLRGVSPLVHRLCIWGPLPVLAFGLFAATVTYLEWRAKDSLDEIGLSITGTMLLLSLPVIILGLLHLLKPSLTLLIDRNRGSVTAFAYGRKQGEIATDDLGKYAQRVVREIHYHIDDLGGSTFSARRRVSRKRYLTAKNRRDVLLYRIMGARDLKRFIGTLEYVAGKCDRDGTPIATGRRSAHSADA